MIEDYLNRTKFGEIMSVIATLMSKGVEHGKLKINMPANEDEAKLRGQDPVFVTLSLVDDEGNINDTQKVEIGPIDVIYQNRGLILKFFFSRVEDMVYKMMENMAVINGFVEFIHKKNANDPNWELAAIFGDESSDKPNKEESDENDFTFKVK